MANTKSVDRRHQTCRYRARTNYDRQYIQKSTTNYGPLCEPIVHHQLNREIQLFFTRMFAVMIQVMYVTLVSCRSRILTDMSRRFGIPQLPSKISAILPQTACIGLFDPLPRMPRDPRPNKKKCARLCLYNLVNMRTKTSSDRRV